MEKKGKKFNTLEARTFVINNQTLQQIDKSNKRKDLPNPSFVSKEMRTEGRSEWGFANCAFRILL
jgi:hypothetical protein